LVRGSVDSQGRTANLEIMSLVLYYSIFLGFNLKITIKLLSQYNFLSIVIFIVQILILFLTILVIPYYYHGVSNHHLY